MNARIKSERDDRGAQEMIRLPRSRKLVPLALLLLLGLVCFELFRAIHPGEGFYRTEFERVTGIEFPDSARFVFKQSSFPDHFGDYTSCALFVVDEADYRRLSRYLESLLPRNAALIGSDCWRDLIEAHGAPLTYSEQISEGHGSGEFRHWGLLNDGQSVVFHLVSW